MNQNIYYSVYITSHATVCHLMVVKYIKSDPQFVLKKSNSKGFYSQVMKCDHVISIPTMYLR